MKKPVCKAGICAKQAVVYAYGGRAAGHLWNQCRGKLEQIKTLAVINPLVETIAKQVRHEFRITLFGTGKFAWSMEMKWCGLLTLISF